MVNLEDSSELVPETAPVPLAVALVITHTEFQIRTQLAKSLVGQAFAHSPRKCGSIPDGIGSGSEPHDDSGRAGGSAPARESDCESSARRLERLCSMVMGD